MDFAVFMNLFKFVQLEQPATVPSRIFLMLKNTNSQ
jgi:hypothetical protein